MIDNDSHNRVVKYIDSMIGKPFEWGKTYCFSLVCGTVDAMRGTDFLKYHLETHKVESMDDALKVADNKADWCLSDFLKEMGLKKVNDHSNWETGDILFGIENKIPCFHVYCCGYLFSTEVDGEVTGFKLRQTLKNLESYEVLRCQHS